MNLLPAPEPEFDTNQVPSLTIVETYTKSGKHLGSVARTEDGSIVWEEGRAPGRDCWFLWDRPAYPWS